jgi:hypothetical protein
MGHVPDKRGYRPSEALLYISGNSANQELTSKIVT